jgi:signal transduction histidine kinase
VEPLETIRRWGDALLALGLVVLMLVELALWPGQPWLMGLPFVLMIGLGLTLRRSAALSSLLIVVAAVCGLEWTLGSSFAEPTSLEPWQIYARSYLTEMTFVVPIWITLFSFGVHAGRATLRAVSIILGCLLLLFSIWLTTGFVFDVLSNSNSEESAPCGGCGGGIEWVLDLAFEILAVAAFVFVPLGAGVVVRVFRQRRFEIDRAREDLALEEASRAEALEAERARIARELHDVCLTRAHSHAVPGSRWSPYARHRS